jgi:OOP family OmpA-OmpF porin
MAQAALTLEFPGASVATANRQESPTSFRLPLGPWEAGKIPERLVEGALDQTAWRIDAPGMTTLALMEPLRTQITRDGWTILFECETRACGGFDFRYAIEVIPEPDMHVDLGDFRYLAAERDSGAEVLSLVVSRSTMSGFVQMTRVGANLPDAPVITETAAPATTLTPRPALPAPATGSLAQRLESGGSQALDDLIFPSGAAELAAGDYGSLVELAAYLAANPERAIAIVGHTDASGGLAGNVALSKRRAASVRAMLIDKHGVDPGQVIAEGVGYLAPRASNLTEEGRTQNRRVEVMLTSTR